MFVHGKTLALAFNRVGRFVHKEGIPTPIIECVRMFAQGDGYVYLQATDRYRLITRRVEMLGDHNFDILVHRNNFRAIESILKLHNEDVEMVVGEHSVRFGDLAVPLETGNYPEVSRLYRFEPFEPSDRERIILDAALLKTLSPIGFPKDTRLELRQVAKRTWLFQADGDEIGLIMECTAPYGDESKLDDWKGVLSK